MSVEKKKKSIKVQCVLQESERLIHQEAKRRGFEGFNIIYREKVRQEKSGNQLLKNLSRSECIEYLRTIFVDYTSFCPPYSTIKNGIDVHCEKCPCACHWFFEAEAVCMNAVNSNVTSSVFICDILDIYNFIEQLPRKKKQDFIEENLFDMVNFDMTTAQVYLSPPHFEYNLGALCIYLEANGLKDQISIPSSNIYSLVLSKINEKKSNKHCIYIIFYSHSFHFFIHIQTLILDRLLTVYKSCGIQISQLSRYQKKQFYFFFF